MSDWKIALEVSPLTAKLLVEGWEGDLLKARLPVAPAHPRALLTLLEGLALWSGAPVRAAVSAAAANPQRYGADLFGGEIWPAESALVTFDTALPLARRRRRISGIGDFRALHRVVGGGR